MSHDPIDRFLLDAEKAARQGERELALDLLLLALDTAPGDPTVLVRAHAIRNLLPPSGEGSSSSERPMGDVGASRPERSANKPVVVNEPAVITLPDPELLTVADLEDEEEEPVSPVAPVDELPAEPAPPVRKPWLSPRARRAAVYTLWSALAVGVLTVFVALIHPATVASVGRHWRALFDPLVRAEMAYEDSRFEAAVRHALKASAHPKNAAAANLVLGKAALKLGDRRKAAEALVRTLSADASWATALEVGRLLLAAGDTIAGAQAFLSAFERSAPSEYWPEIATVLRQAGRPEANNIERLMRGDVGTEPSDSTQGPIQEQDTIGVY